jgi:hypothetical protein
MLWLVAFLAVEIPAAIRERASKSYYVKTLSRHVWRWFSIGEFRPWWFLRWLVLAAFMVVLTLHFVMRLDPAYLIVCAVGMVAVIVYSEFFERGA